MESVSHSETYREILRKHQIMHPPRVPHAALDTKRKTAARPFSGLWKVSDPTLLQMTLVAGLLASVLGDCGPPPDLQFASPNNKLNNKDFKTGITLKYTCLPGYSRIGSSSVTCNDRGSWDYHVFCAKKQCRNLGDLPNGKVEVKTDFLFGSTIEFSCSEGYILVGSATSHCEIQDKGVDWSDPLPQCIIAKCEPPPAISNGRHNGGDEDFYTYGSSVTYSCDPDFSMLGKASISCTVENKTIGVWYPSPPTCKNIVCHPPRVRNGNILSGFGPIYHYKDSILFSCKKGYILNGSSLIRCDANNKWHPSPPTCELNSCIGLPDIPHAVWDGRDNKLSNQEVFEVGTELKYQCKFGYRPIPDEPLTLTCQENFTWTPSKGCEYIVCHRPQVPNGIILSGVGPIYHYKDSILFSCKKGYILNGSSSIHCGANDKWHPSLPTCELNSCIGLPDIPHAVWDGRDNKLSNQEVFEVGTELKYQCKFGYRPIPDEPLTLTCQENFTWTPSKGCESIVCDPPQVPNGIILSGVGPTYNYEDSVLFSCEKGYILNGSNLIHCGANDKWHPSLPTCELITCVKPEVENGKLSVDKEKYVASENVTVQCNPGFSLVGPQIITCSENTTWHPTVPTCHWVNCTIVCPCAWNKCVCSSCQLLQASSSLLAGALPPLVSAISADSVNSKITGTVNRMKSNTVGMVSWTAADTGGWIFLTILKANMDRTVGDVAPVLNVQRRLEELEQCTLALQQEPCGPEEPSISDCEVKVKCEQPMAQGGHPQGSPKVTEFTTYRPYTQEELVNSALLDCSPQVLSSTRSPQFCFFPLVTQSSGLPQPEFLESGTNLPPTSSFHFSLTQGLRTLSLRAVFLRFFTMSPRLQRIFPALCLLGVLSLLHCPPGLCDCESPPGIDHGQRNIVSKYFQFEREAEYECDEGYTLVGANRLSCTSSGWSPATPQCKALCLKPTIEHGRLSVEKVSYVEPERITIQCESGYRLVGSENITCSEDRTWSPAAPKCEWEYPEGCEQVIAGKKLLQCLSSPEEVKLALEVYKLSLEIALLELQIDKRKDASEW
ncbi:C4b-binding protein alpha chain-like [Cervus elaphus]|uniref:C4b-binding protein alpha chain-like n=1 Tax=Cervus elaphus TaxID=9860 RepID=UPI001CC2926A|nr:C4b-binding protein alpha chain-like [Cervus elaphus]